MSVKSIRVMKLESVRWPECCGSSRLCARGRRL